MQRYFITGVHDNGMDDTVPDAMIAECNHSAEHPSALFMESNP